MKTEVVQITIRRSLASEPTDVVEAHEVPILKICHGAGKIAVVEGADCSKFDRQPREVKPRDLLIAMKKKYNAFSERLGGQNPVDIAFPDGSRDIELFYEDPGVFADVGEEEGGGVLTDEFTDPADETPVVAETPAPVVAETPAPAPVVAETPAPVVFDRVKAMSDLTELGVPFAGNISNVNLEALLTRSLEVTGSGAE